MIVRRVGTKKEEDIGLNLPFQTNVWY
jgi:hypothetical protein